ncbi:MAG: hypothetical protein H6976_01690 [Gammaproteobacteria bacterium]|nr:hypothetical protein [Gammaproteobacteria bacterium]
MKELEARPTPMQRATGQTGRITGGPGCNARHPCLLSLRPAGQSLAPTRCPPRKVTQALQASHQHHAETRGQQPPAGTAPGCCEEGCLWHPSGFEPQAR